MVALSLAMMMLVFGQIPITDTLIARNTPEHWRARAYPVKYVLSFVIAATVVPAISRLHGSSAGDGFTTLFLICPAGAALITVAVTCLPAARPAALLPPGDCFATGPLHGPLNLSSVASPRLPGIHA